MIIIIGAMGIGLDAAFEKIRGKPGKMVRAGLRYSLELRIERTRCHDGCLLGIVTNALLVALWQAFGVVRLCPGVALPPRSGFMRLGRQLLTGTFPT